MNHISFIRCMKLQMLRQALAALLSIPAAANSSDEYTNVVSFTCTATQLEVQTTCQRGRDGEPPNCRPQRIEFSTKKNTKNISAPTSKVNERYPASIFRIRCLKNKSRYIAALDSTNYGNCKNCEWSDYYSISGVFIGSNKKSPVERNQRGDQINSKNSDLDEKSIEIDRAEISKNGYSIDNNVNTQLPDAIGQK